MRTAFAADEHLGRLARWLRLAGMDVVHSNPFPDSELTRLARSGGRVVLSMDSRLAQTLGSALCLRIRSYDVSQQFLEVFRAYPGDPLEKAFTRCSLCNAPLREATPEEVETEVPPRARDRGGEFHTCTECRKIFWEGTHYRRMRDRLESLRSALEKPGTVTR